jgi:rfaE bifunctional protein kinase chain/domain
MGFGEMLDSLEGLRAVVLGDVMLDEYIVGSVDRISPEAPVMVVRKKESRWVPGGAANVAKNIAALGGEVEVIGVVGDDEGGARLQEAIEKQGGLRSRLVVDGTRVTTRKTRVVANHSHQVLRIDEEVNDSVSTDVVDRILEGLNFSAVDLVVLSDYLKGMLTEGLVSRVIGLAREAGKPVVVNAKPQSAGLFGGADLVTLNRGEAAAVIGERPRDLNHAKDIAEELFVKLHVEGVLVTMGELGMSAGWRGGSSVVRAPEVEAYDVAGAGDTVLATVGMGLARHGYCDQVFELGAEMGARVVQHIGVAVPTQRDLDSIRSLS